MHGYGKGQKWLNKGKKGTIAGVAQLVEQLPCKQQVNGSSPFASFDETPTYLTGQIPCFRIFVERVVIVSRLEN